MRFLGKSISWINTPQAYRIEKNHIEILAGPQTDLFIDPQGETTSTNSPLLVFQSDERFQFSAKVTAELKSQFDAAALVVYANERCWAKLCYELSPDHHTTLVTVVSNNGPSDDCNHEIIEDEHMHLRISGLGGGVFAFHIATEGRKWHLVRYFKLESDSIRIGFSSQSPTGESCRSLFVDPVYSVGRLGGLRTGD